MLELRGISVEYEGRPLLDHLTLTVGDGETVCLLGASGSGKSTLLRVAAGLESPQAGSVWWDGVDITRLAPERRRFGFMFQDYALFPHMDVRANVAFGLRMQQRSRGEVDAAVREALALVNLEGFENRRVYDLSGGEQQRVALARTLAPRPRLLMLDEPLGALDRMLREELGREIRRVLRQAAIPALYVTHDQEEAAQMGGRMALLHHGRIVQEGAPAELAARPADVWVAKFLGLGNLIPGRVKTIRPLAVATLMGVFPASDPNPSPRRMGDAAWILLEPAGGRLVHGRRQSAGSIEGVVAACRAEAGSFRILLAREDGQEAVFFHAEALPHGERVCWRPRRAVLIAEAAGGMEPAGKGG